MSTKSTLIAAAINTGATIIFKVLLSSQFWADVKHFVFSAADTDLPNPEKHALVKKNLTTIFSKDLVPVIERYGQTFLDVAIKLGVLYLSAKSPAIAAAAEQVLSEKK